MIIDPLWVKYGVYIAFQPPLSENPGHGAPGYKYVMTALTVENVLCNISLGNNGGGNVYVELNQVVVVIHWF